MKHRQPIKLGVTAILSALLASCAVGPDYQRPEVSVRSSFLGAAHLEQAASPQLKHWWTGFGDETLNTLVTDALEANFTVAAALARLGEARYGRQLSQGDLFPGGAAKMNYEESEISSLRAPGITEKNISIWDAGFDATWELDFWGAVRRKIEIAEANEGVAAAELATAQQSIAAEVVRAYIELRSAQRRVAVAQKNSLAQARTVELTQHQWSAGQVTELDVVRARTAQTTTEASIPPLRQAEDQYRFRLAVLCGKEPTALYKQLGASAPVPLYRAQVGLDSPEAMLRRRPEVIRAEHELAGALADIGVEIANYFPQISLVGDLTFEADTLSGVFNDSTRVFSVGPQLIWRGFDVLRVSRRVNAREAEAQAREAEYRTAVLSAIEEVENSLSRYGNERQRSQLLSRALQDAEKAVKLSKLQYDAGEIDLLAVLDSEQRMLLAEDSLVLSEASAMTSLVSLIKSLGIPPDQTEQQAP